jgi:hypothetical protein
VRPARHFSTPYRTSDVIPPAAARDRIFTVVAFFRISARSLSS